MISCFTKIQIGLTFQVTAYLGCPEKPAVQLPLFQGNPSKLAAEMSNQSGF